MGDFYRFMMRHGEHGVQDLIEHMERIQGIKADPENLRSLEERWAVVMQMPQTIAA